MRSYSLTLSSSASFSCNTRTVMSDKSTCTSTANNTLLRASKWRAITRFRTGCSTSVMNFVSWTWWCWRFFDCARKIQRQTKVYIMARGGGGGEADTVAWTAHMDIYHKGRDISLPSLCTTLVLKWGGGHLPELQGSCGGKRPWDCSLHFCTQFRHQSSLTISQRLVQGRWGLSKWK